MADRSSVFLLLGYLGALAWAVYELQWSAPSPQDPTEPVAVAQTQFSVPSVAIGELDAFAELIERPLFTPNRRSLSANDPGANNQPPAPTSSQPLELTNARLTAILVDGDRFTALVEQSNGTTLPLGVGSKLDEWKVDEIQEDRITLVAGGKRRTLEVYRFDPPPKLAPRQRRSPTAKRNARAKTLAQGGRPQGAAPPAPQNPTDNRRTVPRRNPVPREGITQ